jgi:hypothetical protein
LGDKSQSEKQSVQWEANAEERKVQEADDEEWSSATATGGEAGECKKAIE